MSSGDDRPWDAPAKVRRDAEPHRGEVLIAVATISVICGWFSWCLLLPSLVGLPLAMAACVMSRRDLERMRTGVLDRRGRGMATMAWQRGIDGLVLNIPTATLFLFAYVRLLSGF